MAGRAVKVSERQWVEIARQALIEEGIGGVRVDRLAKRLDVTRGGFYHNFEDREQLLDALLHLWEDECRFLPTDDPDNSPADADRPSPRTGSGGPIRTVTSIVRAFKPSIIRERLPSIGSSSVSGCSCENPRIASRSFPPDSEV